MSLRYLQVGPDDELHEYHFSYQESKEEYHRYIRMTDEEFFTHENIICAMHFACFVGWIKEISPEALLSDVGLIHLLVHQLHIGNDPIVQAERNLVRQRFQTLLELV